MGVSVDQRIALPHGGGALQGIGETFSPDLHTGTGNFTIPIAVPPGRNGFQPTLGLAYSTGSGNGPFGLGWSLGVPTITRKTAKGVPRYRDRATDLTQQDVFLLSGSEDLVPVPGETAGARRYRPRSEGLFARIDHFEASDYWEVRTKDGLLSRYGAAQADGERTVVRNPDPDKPGQIFAWRLTETIDPFGNRICYEYRRDASSEAKHRWDELYLSRILYVDYPEAGATKFLVTVSFEYEDRPDPFSDFRAGFEIRTQQRCKRIVIRTEASQGAPVRSYDLTYLDQQPERASELPYNGTSLLSRVVGTGYDGESTESLPAIDCRYTRFVPEERKFFPLRGDDLPARSLAGGEIELVDLFGRGLPDFLEMNGTVRYWRNRGGGVFDRPRPMTTAPAGLRLGDPGVQLVDADGNGRADLLVTAGAVSGHYPLSFEGRWDERSFQPFKTAPSFDLRDPQVHLVDLDGDGVTDVLRAGSRLECFFNRPDDGWGEMRVVDRAALVGLEDINFADPRLHWADMNGDGLQDIVLICGSRVDYWPAQGYGTWGTRVTMHPSPQLPFNYDPRRVLLGDVDGDGAADLVYVADHEVMLWINRAGNGWSERHVIRGTPRVTDLDALRLVDLLGNGVAGLLWSADVTSWRRNNLHFLDFTGGVKPYLLNEMNNNTGAVTRVAYAPSTRFYLSDERHPETRWRTPLPFPVQVVAQSESIDAISGGRRTTEYSYHHGFWDGVEREFRGFGRVDQRDTDLFTPVPTPAVPRFATQPQLHSPPLETRTWFHQGEIGDTDEWSYTGRSQEYWSDDQSVLVRPPEVDEKLGDLPRSARRDALRALRGRILRTELFALDGTPLEEQPYTVTEHQYGIREIDSLSPPQGKRVFFVYPVAERTTQWERGSDPQYRFTFTDDYDGFGQPRSQIAIAVPRGRDFQSPVDTADEAYLATHTVTEYAQRDDEHAFIADRVSRATGYEITNNGTASLLQLKTAIESGAAPRNIFSQSVNFYDGPAFRGLPFGEIGNHGALVRAESLMLTENILENGYRSGSTVLTPPEIPPYMTPAGLPNVNVAAAVNGGTASASSTYEGDNPPSAVINGDRTGPVYLGYWADDTYNVYPDWIEVAFSGAKVINEIDVFTTQDAPLELTGPPLEPTLDMTFQHCGITAFDVQYWNGSSWVTVPNGGVTNNNKVWRQFKFADITTTRIRVFVNNAVGGRARVVEIEAYESGTGTNVALATNGGTATASSVVRPWPPRLAIDGDRLVYHWVGETPFRFPGWLQVNFSGQRTINEIDVFQHQDVSKPFVTPTEDLTTPYALTDFEVQYWNSTAWVTVPGGNVTGNDKVWRKFRFPFITTDRVRLLIHNSSDGFVRVQELEAYETDAAWLSGDYPQEFQSLLATIQAVDPTRPALNITPAGYGISAGDPTFAAGYFAATLRQRFDFQGDPLGRGCGLVTTTCDAFGHETTITYDSYRLLPVEVTNPAGLPTSATYNYRTLQPAEVIDANGNHTAFAFTPLGLLETVATMGKPGEPVGDTPSRPSVRYAYDFGAYTARSEPISARTIRRVHHASDTAVPLPERDETIESVEYSDGFGRLLQSRSQAEDVMFGEPSFGGGVLPADAADDAGPGADVIGRARTATDPINVVVSGAQTYDNKGRVVEKYEPFFATGWAYAPPSASQTGQKAVLYYDPRGQVIRTVNPDGSELRVVHGTPRDLTNPDDFIPTPWEAYSYSTNDNAGRTPAADPNAAAYDHHWNTPSSIVIDGLGRTVATIDRNRARRADPVDPLPPVELLRSTASYDARGNLLSMTDALGRRVVQQTYDLANRRLRRESLDAGLERSIFDAAGNMLEARDAKGALTLRAYDALNRPIRAWARDGAGLPLTLRERLVYGDSPEAGPSDAAQHNLLGRLYHHYDEAGLLTLDAYDFKGNILEKSRRCVSDSNLLATITSRTLSGPETSGGPASTGDAFVSSDSSSTLSLSRTTRGGATTTRASLAIDPSPATIWRVAPFLVDWDSPNAGTLLDITADQTSFQYDALNRVQLLRYPRDANGLRRELHPIYNRAGALERVRLDNDIYVESIAYNARGQRTLIVYGNGMLTRNAYDTRRSRLVRLRSERCSKPDASTPAYRLSDADHPLQDLCYTYDLDGNIFTLTDRTPGCGVINNPDAAAVKAIDPLLAGQLAAGEALIRRFAYDPLGRLETATGRACADIPLPRPWDDTPYCGFGSGAHGTPDQDNAPFLTSLYRESYAYDPAGNLLRLRHQRGEVSSIRYFGIDGHTPAAWDAAWREHSSGDLWPDAPSNRLTHVGDDIDVTIPTHRYDPAGNLRRQNTDRHFFWDAPNRLRLYCVRVLAGTEETPGETIGSEPSIAAHYLYDGAGQRVKKLVRTQGGAYETTVYIDGIFERRSWTAANGTPAASTVHHIMDDKRRIAMARSGADHPQDQGPHVQYHLGDHLDSSTIVIDGAGAWINREEYSPYGETVFGSFARKRYRFTGKQRDAESGLYYHGARYYAPWLARWASSDPAGLIDGNNVFVYARNNPVRLVDRDGRQSGQDQGAGKVVSLSQWSQEDRWTGAWPPSITPDGPAARELAQSLSKADAAANTGLQASLLTDIPGWDNTWASLGAEKGLPNGQYSGLASAVGVQQVAEGGVAAAIHMDVTGVEVLGRGQTPGELRNVITTLQTESNQNVDVHILENGRLSTIPRGSTQVVGAPLPDRIAERLPNITPPSASVASATPSTSAPSAGPALPLSGSSLQAAGSVAGSLTRATVPGVAEAEAGLIGAAYYASGSAATASLVTPLLTAAEAVPVAGAGVIAGGVGGNLYEDAATSLGASKNAACASGAFGAALTGAAAGALVGAPTVIGAPIGAVIGGVVGLGGYALSKWL